MVYDRAAIRIKGSDAHTNFPKPSVPTEIDVETISSYDSSRESHSLCSPTSVLEFQAEAELRTELEPEPSSKPVNTAWPPVQKPSEEPQGLQGDFLSSDPFLYSDIFNYEIPAPIFFDEIIEAEPVSKQDEYGDDFSFKLDEDLGSCLWDVDSYFEDPFPVESTLNPALTYLSQ